MSKSEIEFVGGLVVKAPRDGAPDFVKAGVSIKRDALIAWLQARADEWVNIDIKEAKSGKWYAAVNAWKPNEGAKSGAPKEQDPFPDDDIPF